MTEIVVKLSGKETVRQRIHKSILVIGRGKNADLRIDDLHFSRKHAQLERHAEGFRLRDLGSVNGTRLNGDRVEEPVNIGAQDKIAIGEYTLRLHEDGAPDPPFVEDSKKQAFVMVVQTEGMEPKRYALLGDHFTIGRSEEANIPLRSKRISRNHALLSRTEGDAPFSIEDERSQNGTWINGERMAQKTELRVGDNVWIPPYHLHLAQHEVAVPTPCSNDELYTDDNPFADEANASLLLRGGDLGEGSGRSLAAAENAWSDHLSKMDNQDKMWEAGTDVEPISVPRPGQSFEDTSKAKEKRAYEPGLAIMERNGQRLAEINMNRPMVVVGDTVECDVVLRAGDFSVGPQLVLCPTPQGDLVVVQLLDRNKPAVVVRCGRSVELSGIVISFHRDSDD